MKKTAALLALLALAFIWGPPTNSFPEDATASQFARWQNETRPLLEQILYNDPDLKPAPLEPEFGESQPREGYSITPVSFHDRPGHVTTGWLARPDEPRAQKLPAVIALHGHGGTALMTFDPDRMYYYGDLLARRGYIVFAIDIDHKDVDYPKISRLTLPHNGPWMGRRVWMVRRGLDLLLEQPGVDADHIGIVGLSNGSLTTMFVSALDERISLTVASGSLIMHRRMWHAELSHCRCQYLDGLDGVLDYSDVFALVAPRPLVIQSGEKDPIFPINSANQAFERVKLAYTIAGAPDQVIHDIHDGKHEFRAEVPLRWFARYLPLPGGEPDSK